MTSTGKACFNKEGNPPLGIGEEGNPPLPTAKVSMLFLCH